MKKITLLLLLLFSIGELNAQIWTINSCSNLGSNTYGPMYSTATANANNRTAVIYPASQLGTLSAQTLNAMYFQRNTTTGTMAGTPNFKIYLKEVTATDWGTTAIDWATETTGATLVYDSNPASIVGSDAGWKSFPLSTNFLYSGTQNLAVFMEYSNATASSNITWNYEYTAPCSITTNSNTTKYNNNTTGTLSASLASTNFRRPLIAFDFVVSCNAPNTLTATNVTTSGVNLGWTENAIQPQNGYEYYNSTSNTTPSPTQTPTGTTATGVVTASLSGLTPATTYYYWVRGNCGASDKSIWSGPIAYTTLCVNVAAFVENFDSWPTGSAAGLPVCWSKKGTGNAYLTTGSSTPMSAPNRLYANISTTTDLYIELPPVSNLQAGTHRLKFTAYCSSANKVLSVGYFATPGNEATYVEIDPLPMPSTNVASAQEFTIIPTGIPAGVNQLVFKPVTGASTTIYIDDVKWEVNSSCVEPSALTASMITNSSASLGWTNGGAETSWDIQYGLTNFALGSGTIVSGVATNPYSLSGLTANTEYQFYVRAVCTGPTNSSWSGPFTFKSQCNDLTEYSENFDSYATGSANPLPDCWAKGGTGSTYLLTGASAPMSAANRLYMFASGVTPTESYAILPAVSNLQANTHRLKFKGYATVAGRFVVVGYLTDASNVASFVQLQEIYLPSNNVASTLEFIINPTGIPAGVKNLCIKNPGYPASTTAAYIDDVIWEAIPACPSPTTLDATGVLATSAQLSWTEMGSATLWNVEYGPTGYTQGTGGTLVSGVTTNPYALTALTPATTYDYYVQANCGGTSGVSIWTGPFTFTTACVAFTAPYNENFDSLALTSPYTDLPNCWEPQVGPDFWDVTNGTTNSPQYLPSVVDHTTGTSNFMWIDASTNITANEMISPLIDMSALTAPYVGFWFASNNVTNTINHTIALDVWNGSTWINIAMLTGNFTEWVQVAGAVPSSIPSITKFKIYAIANPIGTTSDYFQNDLGIDDFFVKETPSCPMPSNLTAASITSNSAQLSWTENGSAALWNVEYGPTGYTQGTGGTLVSGVTTNPYSLTTLAPATTFDYYVQSDCGGTSGASTWAGPFVFTTQCTVFSAPFTEGFENGGAIPNCWTMTGGEDWQFSNAPGSNHIGDNGTMAGSTATGNYFAWVDDSGTPPNDVTLTSPLINVSTLTTPRLTFYEISNNEGFTNATLKVEVWDGAAWNLMGTYNTNTPLGWEKKTISLSSLTLTGNVQVRFIIEGSTNFYDDIAIDDVTIEETPTVAPACATNIVATPNATCGNEATVINWNATPLADGYYITMGTATGLSDVLNNFDAGAAPTYSYVGLVNTTYYYTITPYNASGTPTGCTEQSFMTAATGCYCVSNPSSNDGSGITNVQLGTTDFVTGDVTYFDHSATAVSFAQGANTNTQISFATGYTYGTNIWIDFNDNYIFDASEIVYTGESLSTNPTVLDASFVMPTTATLGTHKMRIGTADTGQATPNPCYSGTWGVTLDFSVTVTPLLSSDNFDKTSFVAYPNPVNNVLNLSYSNEITSYRLLNLLGQEVKSNKVNNTSTQIDMSDLSAGTYILNVTIEDYTKTIKVVKN